MTGNNLPNHLGQGPWKEISFEKRIRVVEVENFDGFFTFVNRTSPGNTSDELVWRGQRRAEWEITSTLTRSGKAHQGHIHLDRFARAISRSTNLEYNISENQPDTDEQKNKLWSLGQHYGLATPLIDFTIYPLFALFFAFVEPDDDPNGKRAIVALDVGMGMIPSVNFEITENLGIKEFRRKLENPPYDDDFKKILSDYEGLNRPLVQTGISSGVWHDAIKDRIILLVYNKIKKKQIRIHRPLSVENRRLHSQGGLHVCPPDALSVEAWINTHHEACKLPSQIPLLTKILIPNRERDSIRSTLNRMGIHFVSIFPDLEGAARHCNLALALGHLGRIRDY